jgi:hypothetical protein
MIVEHSPKAFGHSDVKNEYLLTLVCYVKVKQSRNTHLEAQGERRYSSSFTTSVLDGGEWSASRPGRALPPGKGPPAHIGQVVGWAPEPVWTQGLGGKFFASVCYIL